MKTGDFIEFGSEVKEMISLDDCLLVKAGIRYYIVLKFRDQFIKSMVTKKKFYEILRNTNGMDKS